MNEKSIPQGCVEPRGFVSIYRLSSDIRKAVAVFRDKGLLRGISTAFVVLSYRLALLYVHRDGLKFDKKHHVQTSDHVSLSELTVSGPNKKHGVPYDPTPVKVITWLLRSLHTDLSDFVLVDFGSGKGRVLLLASQFNFKRIIGVEFAEELHKVAHKNIKDFKSSEQICAEIDLFCMDAAKFALPNDKCICFIFNAFDRELLKKIIQNIEQSYLANPRKLYIIFYNPETKKQIGEIFTHSEIFNFRKGVVKSLKPPWYVISPCKYIICDTEGV